MYRFQKLNPEKEEATKIFKGAIFKKKVFYFKSYPSNKATFTNIYEIVLNENLIDFDVLSALKAKYPKSFLKNEKEAIIINAGFNYSSDINKKYQPINSTYHLHILNNQLLNIPTRAKIALLAKDKKIKPLKIKAEGNLYFNQKLKIPWVGSHESKKLNKAIIFGLSNQGLLKYQNRKIKIIPDKNYSFIPKIVGYKNVVIGLKKHKQNFILYIKNISNEKIKILNNLFIIAIPNKMTVNLKKGDMVTNWNIGGYSRKDLENAVTVGIKIEKSLKKLYKNIKNEKIIITRNPINKKHYYSKIDSQKARTCIFKTKDKKIHFLLIDARPKIFGQQGMTMRDLMNYIHKNYNVTWAVNCDGGQSSKICFKTNNKLYVFGNLHYLKFKNNHSEWNGRNGRPISSLVIAKPKNKIN